MPDAKQTLVLLAEDDDELREVLSARLTREGMRVIEVEDGYELHDYLDLCRPGGDLAVPDVVVADVGMPGQTGPDAIADSPFFHSPVVLISGGDPGALRELAAQPGVAAMFEKPFEVDLLVLAIRRATCR